MTTNISHCPEFELPTGISMNRWAKPLWWKRDASGAVVSGWQLYPLPIYVIGWSSWAGSRVIPKLRDGFVEVDATKALSLVAEIGHRIFAAGPTEAMIEEATAVRAKYASNGARGGRGKKQVANLKVESKVPPAAVGSNGRKPHDGSWQSIWAFGDIDGKPAISGPANGRRERACIDLICKHYGAEKSQGKSLAWWKKNGPTPELIEAFQKFAQV